MAWYPIYSPMAWNNTTPSEPVAHIYATCIETAKAIYRWGAFET